MTFLLATFSGLIYLPHHQLSSWWVYCPFIILAGLLSWQINDAFLLITLVLLGALALEDVEKQAAHTDLLIIPIIWLLFTQWHTLPFTSSGCLILIGSYLVYRQVLGSGDVMVCLFFSLVLPLTALAYVLLLASLLAAAWLLHYRSERIAFLPFLVSSYALILCFPITS